MQRALLLVVLAFAIGSLVLWGLGGWLGGLAEAAALAVFGVGMLAASRVLSVRLSSPRPAAREQPSAVREPTAA
jgi:hypothetical protein